METFYTVFTGVAILVTVVVIAWAVAPMLKSNAKK